MPARFDIGPYDPCPCGSGKKYKFCCAQKAKENRHGKFPVGTVAYYGPDDKTITKIAAGVILSENAEAIMERWTSTTVMTDPKVHEQIMQFFARHGVKTIVHSDGAMGCPHEEGEDFPVGQECPFCPFWRGKQGIDTNPDKDDDWDDDEQIADDLEDDDNDAGPVATVVQRTDNSEELKECIHRIDAVVGDPDMDRNEAVDKLLAYLQANLQLPCEVTGGEDFRWEEPYVIGGWSQKEYKTLKKTQPSYTDRYELLSLDRDGASEWMMYWDEDICATVRRKSDGKEFVLGLAELKATDKRSPNYQLIRDYGVWFVNSR